MAMPVGHSSLITTCNFSIGIYECKLCIPQTTEKKYCRSRPSRLYVQPIFVLENSSDPRTINFCFDR